MREAYEAWASAGSGRKNGWRVTAEHGSAEAMVEEIYGEVRDRRVTFRPIHRYTKPEGPRGKERTIGVCSVKQQVCNYVVALAIAPLLDARVGRWQTSSVKGRGQLMSARAIRRWSRTSRYHVHLDVRKCYPSLSAEVVMGILRRYVASADVLYLAGAILATYGGGLEIGSYLSLRLAQLALSFGYHHVESLHKVRRGRRVRLVDHQLWYADDVYLLGGSKRDLKAAARSLERYLRDELGVSLKPWKVCRVGDQEPVDVLGYAVRPDRTAVRARTFVRARAAIRRYARAPTERGARRAVACWGWMAGADTRKFARRHHVHRTIRHARRRIAAADRRSNGC